MRARTHCWKSWVSLCRFCAWIVWIRQIIRMSYVHASTAVTFIHFSHTRTHNSCLRAIAAANQLAMDSACTTAHEVLHTPEDSRHGYFGGSPRWPASQALPWTSPWRSPPWHARAGRVAAGPACRGRRGSKRWLGEAPTVQTCKLLPAGAQINKNSLGDAIVIAFEQRWRP